MPLRFQSNRPENWWAGVAQPHEGRLEDPVLILIESFKMAASIKRILSVLLLAMALDVFLGQFANKCVEFFSFFAFGAYHTITAQRHSCAGVGAMMISLSASSRVGGAMAMA
ncbi:hypothetical protein ACFL2Q_13890 [Thermodesulfobacteriota bacterium]